MEKIIRTVQWTEYIHVLFQGFARLCKLKVRRNSENFSEFFAVYSDVDLQELIQLSELTADYFNPDATRAALEQEDKCLFLTYGKTAEALEIIIRKIDELNSCNIMPQLWFFLDEEKNAVVHFISKDDGCYAELYCLSKEPSSYLHLIEQEDKKYLVPVVFLTEKDFKTFWSFATLKGQGRCLRMYLPRESGGLLSKKGKRSSNKEQDQQPQKRLRGGSDGGDTL